MHFLTEDPPASHDSIVIGHGSLSSDTLPQLEQQLSSHSRVPGTVREGRLHRPLLTIGPLEIIGHEQMRENDFDSAVGEHPTRTGHRTIPPARRVGTRAHKLVFTLHSGLLSDFMVAQPVELLGLIPQLLRGMDVVDIDADQGSCG